MHSMLNLDSAKFATVEYYGIQYDMSPWEEGELVLDCIDVMQIQIVLYFFPLCICGRP